MKLPSKAVEEFQSIYFQKFHKSLTFKESEDLANKFILLFSLLTGNVKGKNEYEKTKLHPNTQ